MIPDDIKAMIDHFKFDRLPVEGTFYKGTYRSSSAYETGRPYGTAMIGMYCESPLSVSCFHRLESDEIWHFYGGDPLHLYLLYPAGRHERVILGSNVLGGEQIQALVPAGVWQAGAIIPGGRYSIFGCTMAPGFTGSGFEAAIGDRLAKEYPDLDEVIRKLSVNGHQTKMPDGFAE